MKTRIVVFFAFLTLALFISWLFGVDFDRRSKDLGMAALFSLIVAFLSVTPPDRE